MGRVLKTSKVAMAIDENKSKALNFRKAGLSYEQISQALGLSKSRCHQLVTEAMADIKVTINEDAHFVVELELERLDTLLTSLWSNRDNPRNADSILRVMERKHKLLGIEAPTRIEQTGANGDPIKIQAMANLSRWETKDLETLSKLDNKYRVNDDEPTQSD